MQSELSFLKRLLQYELRCAERYRRFVSLVVVGSMESAQADMGQVLHGSVRSSDEMAMVDGAAAILMAETDADGARAAVDRYKRRYADALDLRFGVVTFPEDGKEGDALLDAAMRRYADAVQGEVGAVVDHG